MDETKKDEVTADEAWDALMKNTASADDLHALNKQRVEIIRLSKKPPKAKEKTEPDSQNLTAELKRTAIR